MNNKLGFCASRPENPGSLTLDNGEALSLLRTPSRKKEESSNECGESS